MINKKAGIFNIISNNINLEHLINLIYDKNVPTSIEIYNGEIDKFNLENNNIPGIHVIVDENIKDQLIIL